MENGLLSKLVMNTAQAHWNEHYLSGGPLGSGRVVFGLITASVVFGLAGEDMGERTVAELGCSGLRFLAPVHHGDTLYAFSEVLSAALDPDRPGTGRVRFKHWGITQDERLVFEGERTVALMCRPPVAEMDQSAAGAGSAAAGTDQSAAGAGSRAAGSAATAGGVTAPPGGGEPS